MRLTIMTQDDTYIHTSFKKFEHSGLAELKEAIMDKLKANDPFAMTLDNGQEVIIPGPVMQQSVILIDPREYDQFAV